MHVRVQWMCGLMGARTAVAPVCWECVCARMRACVHACVRACMRATTHCRSSEARMEHRGASQRMARITAGFHVPRGPHLVREVLHLVPHAHVLSQ